MKITGLAIAIAAFVFGAGGAQAQTTGDAAAGENLFRRCATCHAVGEGARNKVGPVLNGIVGRQAGTFEGYSYSSAMVEAGAAGLVWAPDQLAQYLHAPKEKVPGNKMAFAGLKTAKELADVVAYLTTLSPDFAPDAAPENPAGNTATVELPPE